MWTYGTERQEKKFSSVGIVELNVKRTEKCHTCASSSVGVHFHFGLTLSLPACLTSDHHPAREGSVPFRSRGPVKVNQLISNSSGVEDKPTLAFVFCFLRQFSANWILFVFIYVFVYKGNERFSSSYLLFSRVSC